MAGNRLGWGHINLNVTDIDESLAFYELLGFSILIPAIPYLGIVLEEYRPVNDVAAAALDVAVPIAARGCIVELSGGFPKLDLTEYDKAAQSGAGAADGLGLVRLCLSSVDLQSDYERLCALGVRFVSPPVAAQGGSALLATCLDPDGVRIELIQLVPDKWQALMKTMSNGDE